MYIQRMVKRLLLVAVIVLAFPSSAFAKEARADFVITERVQPKLTFAGTRAWTAPPNSRSFDSYVSEYDGRRSRPVRRRKS